MMVDGGACYRYVDNRLISDLENKMPNYENLDMPQTNKRQELSS